MPPLIIALQVWNGDIEQGIELMKLIVDIEKTLRKDIECCIMARRDTDRDLVTELAKEANKAFFKIHVIYGRRFGTGHPIGPNDLWQELMMRLDTKHRVGTTEATGVLAFEPDCIPLRPDWLDLLSNAWQEAYTRGIECLGHAHRFNGSASPRHINGNAIFRIDITERHPEMNGSPADVGWDVEHGSLLLSIGEDTDLIYQKYRIQRIAVDDVKELRKNGNIPALFHGIKSLDGINAVREMMKTDEFEKRRSVPFVQTPVIKKMRESRLGLPTFSISILAMNGLAMTMRCVESVLKNSDDFELILTSNGSEQAIVDYFDELASLTYIKVIHNETNKGFIEPNIKALEISRGTYFITLNNDAEVPEGWMEKLEEPFLMSDNVAITGPEGSCSMWTSDDNFHGVPGGQVEYIEGSCMCVRTDLARKHGLFAGYIDFAYGEDCDLSLRMRAQGYLIHTVPFQIKHIRSATSKHVPGIEAIKIKNHHAMRKRWGSYLKLRRFNWPILIKRKEAIGDVLLTTPLIRAIHEQQPQSKIYVETDFPDIFFGNRSIEFAEKVHIPTKDTQVIDLNMSYEKNPGQHIVKSYFDEAGYDFTNDKLDFFHNHVDRKWAEETTSGLSQRLIALNVGPTTWTGKNWPMENWSKVVELLQEMAMDVVLVGSGNVILDYDLDLRNKTSFGRLGAIITRCDLFIGLDSFPMHAAQACGVPTIGLFGATLPEFIMTNSSPHIGIAADKSIPCAGERHRITDKTYTPCNGDCMKSITVDMVMEAVDKLLATKKANA